MTIQPVSSAGVFSASPTAPKIAPAAQGTALPQDTVKLSPQAQASLEMFCLFGCFSGAQYVVFAGKSANEGRQLSRDRSHTAGSLHLPKPDLWLGPGNFAQPRREGPTGMAERGTQPSSLTTTSGGLLKQPYK